MPALLKNAQLWLPGYLSGLVRRPRLDGTPAHVYFALTDHYEPGWRGADPDVQRERVRAWVEAYPRVSEGHCDSDGRPPQHTYFFPEEEYRPEHLDALAGLRDRGLGDVEVHLHHDGDTPRRLEETLLRYAETLHSRHGLLRRDPDSGRLLYGFIHGNYALNNALPGGRHCGVDDETSVLLDTGCYADFTMPSAPNPAQTRKVNAIYYAEPRPGPRGHDSGPDAEAGKRPPARALLMVQGPLALNWSRRKWGIVPRIDNADLSADNPPADDRPPLWIESQVHVRGAPAHVFVKVSTHGAQDRIARSLLGGGLERMWTALERRCRESSCRLHYVTAYEMYRKIKEVEGVAALGRES
jgi:hypothetical protein